MAQHQRTLRESLRSAMKHKKAADDLLDSIVAMQSRFNTIMTTASADNLTNLAGVGYDTEAAKSNLLDPDADGEGQHKQSIRRVTISTLAHKALANDLLDSVEEMDLALTATATKLFGDLGGAISAGYDLLKVTEDNGDEAAEGSAQSKASRRTIMKSAVAHSRLADQIIDALTEMQTNMNLMLDDLEANTGGFDYTVSILDPDSK